MEQLSLFDAPQLLLGDYYRAIDAGSWNEIPGILEFINKLGVKIPNWQQKVEFWNIYLPEFKRVEKRSVKNIADFWEKFDTKVCEQCLQVEKAHLEKYWLTKIVSKLDENSTNYLTETIHPVYCHLKLNNLKQAADLVEICLNENEEDTRLRTYQAFALNKLGNVTAAKSSLTYAIFYDPFAVDRNFLYDPSLKRLLSALEIEYSDQKLLLASFPFEAWLDGSVEIPTNKQFFRRIESIYRGNIFRKKTPTKIDRQIYFNHLLYISEYYRRKDSLVNQEIISLRSHIKNVHPEAFQKYMDRIR